jgi:hypothetical protein
MHSAQPVPLGGTSGSISLVMPVMPLLLIPLHGVRVSRLRLVGIGPGVAQGPALAQQIPALIEFHFQGAQPLMLLGFIDLAVLQLGAQLLLLGDKLVYLSENVLVLGHGSRLR